MGGGGQKNKAGKYTRLTDHIYLKLSLLHHAACQRNHRCTRTAPEAAVAGHVTEHPRIGSSTACVGDGTNLGLYLTHHACHE